MVIISSCSPACLLSEKAKPLSFNPRYAKPGLPFNHVTCHVIVLPVCFLYRLSVVRELCDMGVESGCGLYPHLARLQAMLELEGVGQVAHEEE